MDNFGDNLQLFMDLGLVRHSQGVLRLTEGGFLVSNEILQVFL